MYIYVYVTVYVCLCTYVRICICTYGKTARCVHCHSTQNVHMPDTDDTQEPAPTIPSYAVPNKKKGKKVCTKYYYICMHVAIYIRIHITS